MCIVTCALLLTLEASAAIVAGVEGEGLQRPLARVLGCRSELLRSADASTGGDAAPDALRLRARYNDATEGMALQMSVAPDWPEQTARLIRCVPQRTTLLLYALTAHLPVPPPATSPFADALLSDTAAATGAAPLTLSRCLVALHPAGNAPLAAAASALSLAPWQAAPASAVLASRGNPSGAGSLMALAVALESARLGPQALPATRPQHLVALALGPGVSAEGVVLELVE